MKRLTLKAVLLVVSILSSAALAQEQGQDQGQGLPSLELTHLSIWAWQCQSEGEEGLIQTIDLMLFSDNKSVAGPHILRVTTTATEKGSPYHGWSYQGDIGPAVGRLFTPSPVTAFLISSEGDSEVYPGALTNAAVFSKAGDTAFLSARGVIFRLQSCSEPVKIKV